MMSCQTRETRDVTCYSPRNKARVLLVDDNDVLRQCLVRLLAFEPCIEIVGQAASGHEALLLVRRLQPDVVVMDIEMPGMDGIQATRILLGEYPELRVIGHSMHDHRAGEMLAAGAAQFLCKDASPTALLEAVMQH